MNILNKSLAEDDGRIAGGTENKITLGTNSGNALDIGKENGDKTENIQFQDSNVAYPSFYEGLTDEALEGFNRMPGCSIPSSSRRHLLSGRKNYFYGSRIT